MGVSLSIYLRVRVQQLTFLPNRNQVNMFGNRQTKQIRFFAMAASLALLTAGCSAGGNNAAVKPGGIETVKIGVPLSLTGTAAFAGVKMRNAMELSFDQLNSELQGVKIDPIFVDDHSDQASTIDVTTRLKTADQVAAITGYSVSNLCQAGLPVAQQNSVPTVEADCVAPGIVDIGNYIFASVIPYDAFVASMIDTLAKDSTLHLKKAGIIYLQANPVFADETKVMEKAFAKNGIKVVGVEAVPSTSDSDFSAQLTNLASKGVDALAVLLLGGQSGPAIAQARQAGMTQTNTIIVGEQNLNSAEVLRTAGSAAENTFYPTHWSPLSVFKRNQDYIAAYKKRFGQEPDTFATNGYEAAQILGAALKKVGKPSKYKDLQTFRNAIRDALDGLDVLQTVYGDGTMKMAHRAPVLTAKLIRINAEGKQTLYTP